MRPDSDPETSEASISRDRDFSGLGRDFGFQVITIGN
jgi:hypothetical protein